MTTDTTDDVRLTADERQALLAPLDAGNEDMRAECIADRVALMVAAAHAEADQCYAERLANDLRGVLRKMPRQS
jgi:hypothetical protein